MRLGLSLGAVVLVVVAVVGGTVFSEDEVKGGAPGPWDERVESHAAKMMAEGRRVFRYETFGREAFWGDQLRLHEGSWARRTAAWVRASLRSRRSSSA